MMWSLSGAGRRRPVMRPIKPHRLFPQQRVLAGELLQGLRGQLEVALQGGPLGVPAGPAGALGQRVGGPLLHALPDRPEPPGVIPHRRHTSASEAPLREISRNTCHFCSAVRRLRRCTRSSIASPSRVCTTLVEKGASRGPCGVGSPASQNGRKVRPQPTTRRLVSKSLVRGVGRGGLEPPTGGLCGRTVSSKPPIRWRPPPSPPLCHGNRAKPRSFPRAP